MAMADTIKKRVRGLPYVLSLFLLWSVAAVASKVKSDELRSLLQSVTSVETSILKIESSIAVRDEYSAAFNHIVHSYTSPAAFRFRINELLHHAVSTHSVSGASEYTLDRRYLLRSDPYARGNTNTASFTVPLQVTEASIDLELESEAQIFAIMQELVSANGALSFIESCVIAEPKLNPGPANLETANEGGLTAYFQLNCALKFFEIAQTQIQGGLEGARYGS